MKRSRELTPLEKRAKWRRAIYYSLFAIFLVSLLFLIPWFVFSASRKNPPLRLVPETPPDAQLVFPLGSTIEEIEENRELSTPLVDLLRFFQPSFPKMEKALSSDGQLLYWRATPEQPARWALFLPLERPQKVFVVFLRQQLEESGLVQFEENGEAVNGLEGLPFGRISSKGVVISSSPLTSWDYRLVPFRGEKADQPLALFESDSGYYPSFLKHLWSGQLSEDEIEWPKVSSFTITWQQSDTVTTHVEFQPELDRDPLVVEQLWFHPLACKDMTVDDE